MTHLSLYLSLCNHILILLFQCCVNFIAEKLAEATRKFHDLEAEVGISNQGQSGVNMDTEGGQGSPDGSDDANVALVGKKKLKSQKSKGARKLKELKFAVSEFYLSLIMIQNFQVK